MSVQPCPLAVDFEDRANTLELTQCGSVNVNRGLQGANIVNSSVYNPTFNIRGLLYEKWRILLGVVTIFGLITVIFLIMWMSIFQGNFYSLFLH